MSGLWRRVAAVTTGLMCGLAIGCVSVEYGSPPMIGNLPNLEPGDSTRAEVLLALGKPRGYGAVYPGPDNEVREILFYEFVQSDGKNVDLEILTVFMDDDIYDGYVWFASSERARKNLEGRPQSGYFPDTAVLETKFVRGQTRREEITAVLGSPVGSGFAVFPPDHRPRDLIFYEDIEILDSQMSGLEMVADVRQRVLLVFFSDGMFDGFMWYSNAGLAELISQ